MPSTGTPAWLDAQVVTGQLDLADIPMTNPPIHHFGTSSPDGLRWMPLPKWGASTVPMRWVIEQRYRPRMASRD
ncbi:MULTISPECIES: hypothetical protein [unclassified Pandoraea]|uniref:hypothetical protein n=1 Tax=unclassified Pandoraea TaxID=2624094 RepID=UPI00034D3861|nr:MULTISPECIES: hypothetical protein [unclassified Pandoraea]